VAFDSSTGQITITTTDVLLIGPYAYTFQINLYDSVPLLVGSITYSLSLTISTAPVVVTVPAPTADEIEEGLETASESEESQDLEDAAVAGELEETEE
jgi:hypothetical protein